MRIAGVVIFVLGALISLSIVGAVIGIPMMFVGALMAIFGGRRKTVITNVVQVSNNGGTPQVAFDPNDRRYRPEPALRSGFSEARLPAPNERPQAQLNREYDYDLEYEDATFTDVRTQLTQNSKRILGLAREDGFDFKARPDSITIRRGDYGVTCRSNEDIHEFAKEHGYL